MNTELSRILKLYTTGSHGDFLRRFAELSKESVIALFTDLLTMFVNDKNSSTIREYITVTVAGFKHSEGKIGFNGFRHASIAGGKPEACEAKPQNFQTNELLAYKEKRRKTKPALLHAGGSFNDYTEMRFKKDKKENPFILPSGFVDGKLMFVFEIPFNSRGIIGSLKKQLQTRFKNGSGPGQYLRGGRITFSDYKNSKELRVAYVAPRATLEECKAYITPGLYSFLTTHAKTKR